MKIIYSVKFQHALKKFPLALVEKVIERTILFEKNIFDSRLNTHKLHGKLKNLWSFSVNEKYRVLFQFGKNKKEVILLDVGDHGLYK